jgi:hypothetical protein
VLYHMSFTTERIKLVYVRIHTVCSIYSIPVVTLLLLPTAYSDMKWQLNLSGDLMLIKHKENLIILLLNNFL